MMKQDQISFDGTSTVAREKIKGLAELSRILASRPSRGKVVQCHGVFDLLHIGHIRHLQQAKRLGEVLVVTLTPDRFVGKGPGRPVFTQALRAETLAALDCVDYVAINEWPTAVEAIKMVHPDLYVKGPDYKDAAQDVTGMIGHERSTVESIGGTVVTTEDITFSSSNLINRYLSPLPDESRRFLDAFRGRHDARGVLNYLEKARELRVLVVGEAIIDEYEYCEAMGKSAKEPVLATRRTSGERFAGGSVAVANHLAGFCDRVGVVAQVGASDDGELFLRDHLKPGVDATFLRTEKAPTITKRRFVEDYLMQKLFEVYLMDDEAVDEDDARAAYAAIEKAVPRYDLVVVADYGHGLIRQDHVSLLTRQAPFLAVNTQTNAGNRGFNAISKYPRTDYACIAAHEIDLEMRERQGGTREQVLELLRRVDCARLIVTKGKYGSLAYGREEGFSEVPAFASKVVDRVGAGDAVLAVTSLLAKVGAPMEVMAFVGNVVGAEAVNIVGNRESIERLPLVRHIETLLK